MPHNDAQVNPDAPPTEPRDTLELRLFGHAEVRLEGRVLALGQRKTLGAAGVPGTRSEPRHGHDDRL
ncbi:MAG: hypothetical protein HC933_23185, partial [Pleurocapsa sp. SU_196_0]|nr:hypothetical protein [Pleurocapsa sp. SU_196_0]